MNINELFDINGCGSSELPEPSVKMRFQSGNTEWTPAQVKGLICNPIYTGIGPYPALIEDKIWIHAASKAIDEDGHEQFLVNLLFLLRQSFESS